jgi:hypothetical protein
MAPKHPRGAGSGGRDLEVNPIFSREPLTIPRYALPAGELDPGTGRQRADLPAYTFPQNCTDLAVLRVVVRNGFGHDLADLFLDDLRRVLSRLRSQKEPQRTASEATGFAHGAEPKKAPAGKG